MANAPIPLEPCPDVYLLRPFWLMRCFYQTIVHPRGGYISTKLFIPRDVWRVKGVKLKYIDEKIANCDMLTAALQKLSSVDTLDADAVLEEMQALELILDQVQTQLAKKLGNEVGVQSVASLFRDAHTVGQGSATENNSEKGSHGSQDHTHKSTISQSKSYLTSWRKLRSKNSGVGLSNMAQTKNDRGEVPKDSLTMATLPMTTLPNLRFAKRDTSNVVYEGPNAGYMGSLARLFDAVQILGKYILFHLPLLYLAASTPSPLQIRLGFVLTYFSPHNRPNHSPSRGPRPQTFVSHTRRPRTLGSSCSRVLWLLHLPVRPG